MTDNDMGDAYLRIWDLRERLTLVTGIIRVVAKRIQDYRSRIRLLQQRISAGSRSLTFLLRYDLEQCQRFYFQWKRYFAFLTTERRGIRRQIEYLSDDLFW